MYARMPATNYSSTMHMVLDSNQENSFGLAYAILKGSQQNNYPSNSNKKHGCMAYD
jgi:hypothetical protein